MQQKIIGFIIGLLVGIILCYGYNNLFVKKSNNFRSGNMMRNGNENFNKSWSGSRVLDGTQYKKLENKN
ncbi:hypothetical protein H3C61_03625 [Candidatus Gracilibacteria bacterium]|nr:hypothetical protein [Candidatus Gracilibacteria bacterium]